MKKINGDNYERIIKLEEHEKNEGERFLEEVIII